MTTPEPNPRSESLGLEYGTIRLVDHDPRWSEAFVVEHASLVACLDGLGSRIEHVGSTAVAGLRTKPILDIAVGLPESGDLDACIERLQRLGYDYRGDAGQDGGTCSSGPRAGCGPITFTSSRSTGRSGATISRCGIFCAAIRVRGRSTRKRKIDSRSCLPTTGKPIRTARRRSSRRCSVGRDRGGDDMLFMVIERFRDDDMIPVYRKLRDGGRMLPEGLTYVDSWVEPNFSRCFQLMECDDLRRFQEWVLQWRGFGTTIEIVPVVSSAETRQVVAPHLDQP
jgi:hypothetical protein